jgi:hypothetical protein
MAHRKTTSQVGFVKTQRRGRRKTSGRKQLEHKALTIGQGAFRAGHPLRLLAAYRGVTPTTGRGFEGTPLAPLGCQAGEIRPETKVDRQPETQGQVAQRDQEQQKE